MSTIIDGTTGVNAVYVKGTTSADNAPAGYIGEYLTSSVAYAGRGTLSSNVAGNVCSISLTAGDWDVQAIGCFDIVTGPTQFISTSVSLTSVTMGGDTATATISGSMTVGYQSILPSPIVRLSLSGTTTVYAVGKGVFSGGTLSLWGSITARRVR